MTETAAALLKKARHTLHAAQLLLDAEEVESAINRSYYAAFYAAQAALVEVGESPKTHKGIHNRFWTRFVETERFPRHQGEIFGSAWKMRQKADYDIFSIFDTAAAADLLLDVETFVESAETLTRDLSNT